MALTEGEWCELGEMEMCATTLLRIGLIWMRALMLEVDDDEVGCWMLNVEC